eukprot:jgi/Botrbrau1/3267/Bobra.174_1s0038.1
MLTILCWPRMVVYLDRFVKMGAPRGRAAGVPASLPYSTVRSTCSIPSYRFPAADSSYYVGHFSSQKDARIFAESTACRL